MDIVFAVRHFAAPLSLQNSASKLIPALNNFLSGSISVEETLTQIREALGENVPEFAKVLESLKISEEFLKANGFTKNLEYLIPKVEPTEQFQLLDCGIVQKKSSKTRKLSKRKQELPKAIDKKRSRKEKKRKVTRTRETSPRLRKAANRWTPEESAKLWEIVARKPGAQRWAEVAETLNAICHGDKDGPKCSQHYKRVLTSMGTVNDWTIDEERSMLRYIKNYGLRWADLAAELQTKKDVQCRYFYMKYYATKEKLGSWSSKQTQFLEDVLVDEDTQNLNWSEIAERVNQLGRHSHSPLQCYKQYRKISTSAE